MVGCRRALATLAPPLLALSRIAGRNATNRSSRVALVGRAHALARTLARRLTLRRGRRSRALARSAAVVGRAHARTLARSARPRLTDDGDDGDAVCCAGTTRGTRCACRSRRYSAPGTAEQPEFVDSYSFSPLQRTWYRRPAPEQRTVTRGVRPSDRRAVLRRSDPRATSHTHDTRTDTDTHTRTRPPSGSDDRTSRDKHTRQHTRPRSLSRGTGACSSRTSTRRG